MSRSTPLCDCPRNLEEEFKVSIPMRPTEVDDLGCCTNCGHYAFYKQLEKPRKFKTQYMNEENYEILL